MGNDSLPARLEDMWQWLKDFVLRQDPSLPAVDSPYPPLAMPQVRHALEQPAKPRGPGRPPRDPETAIDIAITWDLDGERPTPELKWTGRAVGAVSDTGLLRRVQLTFHTHPDGWDSRTLRRWRDDGRRAWSESGAWPWALTPNGKLPRNWWRRPEYAKALHDWAAGRVP